MGGQACAQLIIDGSEALAAIDHYLAAGLPADVTLLKHRIEASCQLIGYESVYLKLESIDIPDSLTDPIDHFHQHIANHLLTMTPDQIRIATEKIGKLNRDLATFASGAT